MLNIKGYLIMMISSVEKLVNPRTDINLYTDPLGENPEIGTRFKPEPPHDMFTRGTVWYDETSKRRSVTLFTPAIENDFKNSLKRNMFVSTYLFSVKYFKETGQLIPKGYSVDHKDNDKWNDTYSNFQLLTKEDNSRKEGRRVGIRWSVLICPICLKQFEIRSNQVNSAKSIKSIFWCSNKCKLVFKATLIPYEDFKELRNWICDNQIYKIIHRYPEEHNKKELISIVSEEMLNFDLAKASGKEIAYDSLRLLDELSKKSKIRNLRMEGKTWNEISFLFGLDTKDISNLVKDDSELFGPGAKFISRNNEIIRLYKEEKKSSRELAEMFKMSTSMINIILQGHRN